MHEIAEAAPLEMLKNINLESLSEGFINERQIELLVKQQGLAKDYQSSKRQIEFISIWQTIVDVNDQKKETMIENAMSNFINHFSLDCALIIDLHAKEPQVLYNDTECDMTDEVIKGICDIMIDYPEGLPHQSLERTSTSMKISSRTLAWMMYVHLLRCLLSRMMRFQVCL